MTFSSNHLLLTCLKKAPCLLQVMEFLEFYHYPQIKEASFLLTYNFEFSFVLLFAVASHLYTIPCYLI